MPKPILRSGTGQTSLKHLIWPKLERNAPCWCGSGKKYKQCHMSFDERIRTAARMGHEVPPRTLLKTPSDIAGIRESAKINVEILDTVAEKICAGMSTGDIDRIVSEITAERGAVPAPLNYEGFPKSVCTSLNDEVCHGIPSDSVILKDGDIINVDVSTIFRGYFSDSSRMFCIGNVAEETRRLVETAKECVEIGIKNTIPWHYLGDMGHAVHRHALDQGFSVVREIGGHGCGLEFHEDPWVSYVSEPGTGMLLVPGMCFTIEPMVNLGRPDIFTDESNGWTVHTQDGLPSAQWEVQVLVTESGCEVLTW
ncbi:MAG: methionyl aminopeptidase [Lachnospiraceae bacterium]|nr:methionyl aminopeptidase [Lachnospiraceae bacterium]